jgi:hypothetical protein
LHFLPPLSWPSVAALSGEQHAASQFMRMTCGR